MTRTKRNNFTKSGFKVVFLKSFSLSLSLFILVLCLELIVRQISVEIQPNDFVTLKILLLVSWWLSGRIIISSENISWWREHNYRIYNFIWYNFNIYKIIKIIQYIKFTLDHSITTERSQSANTFTEFEILTLIILHNYFKLIILLLIFTLIITFFTLIILNCHNVISVIIDIV